jgi:branched-chain amino acid transport system permease protein
VGCCGTFLQFGGDWAQLPTAIPSIALLVVLLFLPEPTVHLGRALRTYRMESVPSWRTVGIASAIVLVATAVAGPLVSGTVMLQLMVAVATGVILLGMVPLLGWAGLPFLAPYGLAGFGAWLAWKLQPDMPGLLGILVAGLVTAAVGAVATIPALRLRGLYLALGSIAFANIAVNLIFPLPALLEADHAVAPPDILGLTLRSPASFLVFAVLVYLVLASGVVWLRKSRFGRRLIATRDSEAASATVGINLVETKAIVFMIAGFIAGIGGALLVEAQQFVSVDQLPLIGGLSIILSLVVFGVGTTSGPLVAGLMTAAFAVISADWLHGNWGNTLTVVGPALAALGLINLPRGAIPEIVADARDHPLLLGARAAGLVIGGVIGVLFQLPGWAGIALAVVGAVLGGVLAGLFSEHRSRSLDALAWPDRPDAIAPAAAAADTLQEATVDSLPVGTQRLVELARALACAPRLLLLDEVASGLSAYEAETMAVLLRELAADGLSVLLVEHDMPFVMGLCEHVSMLDHGVIVVTGTPAEVQANPDVQAAYLGSKEAVS